MKYNGSVKAVEVTSRINTSPPSPADVQVTLDVYDDDKYDHKIGEVVLRMPYGQAKAYPAGRRVTVVVEPVKKGKK